MTKYSSELKVQIASDYLYGRDSYNGLSQKYNIAASIIRTWVKAAELNGLESLKVKRTKREYSVDFKLDVVSYYLKSDVGRNLVAAKFNISPSQVYSWTKKFQRGGPNVLLPIKKGRPAKMPKKTEKAKRNKQIGTLTDKQKYDSQNLAEAEEGMPKLNQVADVKYTVKQEQKTFAWILLLLPVAIISAGPLDQWQMYFQRGKTVNSGTISVLMSLAGMLAISLYNRYVSKKPLSNKGQTRLIVVSTVMMAATLLGVVGLKNWYYGSLALFMLHTMFGSLENMLGGIVLQTTIQTENRRATIMSVANALDAGAEVVILAINGFLSDRYGIGFAWVSLAVLGLVIFLLAIFGMQSKKLEVEEI